MSLYGRKGLVELTTEEVKLIKELCGKAYGPLMVAQIYRMLEAKPDGAESGQKGKGKAGGAG
jgi:hypothetical protein